MCESNIPEFEHDGDLLSEATIRVVGTLDDFTARQLLQNLLQHMIIDAGQITQDTDVRERALALVDEPPIPYKVDANAIYHLCEAAAAMFNLLPGPGWDSAKVIDMVDCALKKITYVGPVV